MEKLEKPIKDRKIAKIKANERKMIFKYFKDGNNKDIFLQIFHEQQIYDDFIVKVNDFYNKEKLKIDKQEKKEIEKGEKNEKKKEIKKEEKKEKKEEIKIEIKDEIKEEKEEELNKEKEIKNSLIEIGKDNINFYQKPKENKENDNSKIEISNSFCDQSTMSNTLDSFIDLKAPEPSLKQQDSQITNKSDIPNFISTKFSALLYSEMKGTEPYLKYDKIQYGNNGLKIDYNRFMEIVSSLDFSNYTVGEVKKLKR